MAVTAPEDRRFRRGRATTPQRRRRKGGRWELGLRVGRGSRSPRGSRSWPGARASARPVCASAGSSCRATCTCRRARCSRCSTACWASRCCAPTSRRGGRGLQQSPWVADAVLRRSLPDAVEVTLTERQPLAIGRLDGRLVLVDASRRGHRRVRAALRGVRPAHRGRARAGERIAGHAPAGAAGAIDGDGSSPTCPAIARCSARCRR